MDTSKMLPQEVFLYWIKERESIRMMKEAGMPRPWTADPILQQYRFCNVRRMDDRVSQWLFNNWYTPNYGDRNMLAAVAFARFINLPSSLELVTDLFFGKAGLSPDIDWGKVITVLRKHKAAGNTVFNGAYMVRGNDGVDKIECVVDYYVRPMLEKGVRGLPDFGSSMEAVWKAVVDCYGYGGFMAGQIVADLRWATPGAWGDKHTWAPMGPGSKRGMNRYLGLDPDKGMDQDKFLGRLRRLMMETMSRLPVGLASRLEAIDYQNCLCEFDKYMRVRNGEGRPKANYPGAGHDRPTPRHERERQVHRDAPHHGPDGRLAGRDGARPEAAPVLPLGGRVAVDLGDGALRVGLRGVRHYRVGREGLGGNLQAARPASRGAHPPRGVVALRRRQVDPEHARRPGPVPGDGRGDVSDPNPRAAGGSGQRQAAERRQHPEPGARDRAGEG
jgi:hypothetical protein